MKILAMMFGLMLMAVMATTAFAADNIPLTIESVEVDGFEISESQDNVRNLERGEEFDVKVFLKANSRISDGDEITDVQVFAFISGFEFSGTESMSDESRAFDLDAGHSTVKTLTLRLPERADEGSYRLRIVVADRNSETIVDNYRIKIEPTDAEVIIKDFDINPESQVMTGRSILATVRIKNLGDSEEDDIKIRVRIPGLGISSTADFIDDLQDDESATSEEFYLRIDRCAKPGLYEIVAEVTFDEGDETITEAKTITVTKGNCAADIAQVQRPVGRTIIGYSTESRDLVAGMEAMYPITITNSGASSKVFMISVDRADWAYFAVSGSGLVSVEPGMTETVFVSATPTADTLPGQKVFKVKVKDPTGKVLKSLTLTGNVVVNSNGVNLMQSSGLRNALTAVLVVIVAILVIVGLVLAFRRVRGGSEGESQTYY